MIYQQEIVGATFWHAMFHMLVAMCADQLTNQPLQGIWITNEYTKNTAILIITVMTSGIWAVRNILTGYAQLLFFVEDCKL